MAWSETIRELIALLKKFGGAIAAFFAGRASVKSGNVRADNKALKKEIEHERDEDAILSDPVVRDGMRERFTKPE